MTVATPGIAGWPPAARTDEHARTRDGAIDAMRGVAILMVIGIHSLPRLDGSPWLIAIDSALRPCVPMFLFASGYLTARTRSVPLGRRIARALGPYTIAFAAAYLFMALSNPAMDHRPLIIAARYGFAYVFVYYFIFVYVGCTVTLWLVFAAARGNRERLLVLLALAIVVGLAAGAYLDPLLRHFGVGESLIEEARMRDLPYWFGFVALGVVVRMLDAKPVLHGMRYILAAATGLAFAFYAAVRVAGIGDAADYDSVAHFLFAALFCLTIAGFALDGRALAALGAASYFIYLWHIFVIVLLRDVPALQQHALAAIPVKFAAALAVSAAFVALVRGARAPRLARWLGI